MTTYSPAVTRPITLVREGPVFRLSFAYDKALVARAQKLPFAAFSKDTRSWTARIHTQTVDQLRRMFREGLVDVAPDDLLAPGEQLTVAPPAILRPGTRRRPYRVATAMRDEQLFNRLRAIPGASWDKTSQALSYPDTAAIALAEYVDKGIIADPDELLTVASNTLYFDGRSGVFTIRGDGRAQANFDKHFPGRDVMAAWADKGLDVAFADDTTRSIYRGLLARQAGLHPEGMAFEPFPFQAEVIAAAVEMPGVAAFLDMGLGKTYVGIGAGLELCTNRAEVLRTVAVVPAALISQWAAEIVKFTGQTDIVTVTGGPDKRSQAYAAAHETGARWVLIPFSETLTKDHAHIGRLCDGAFLIADECHKLRNPDAKRSKAMFALADRATRRLGLTGTPLDNDPGEIHSILSGFCIPGILGSNFDWMSRYAYPGKFGGFEGARDLPDLRERIRPLYIRYTKADVAQHLPPLEVATEILAPDAAYAAVLARAHREAAAEIKDRRVQSAQGRAQAGSLFDDGDGVDFDELAAGAEMTAVGMLRILCSSPRLLLESGSVSANALIDAGLIPDVDGPKVDWVRTFVADVQAQGRRVVVFTWSKRMTKLLAERFDTDGTRYVTFTGDTSRKARDAAVAAFTTDPADNDPGPTVFLATDAGGEGLNLGRCCNLLVNVDLPWTPGALAQRSARIHRLDGTADRYDVINLVLANTLEGGLITHIERKADLGDAVFGEDGGRSRTTGRKGRSAFAAAMDDWAKTASLHADAHDDTDDVVEQPTLADWHAT